MTLTELKAYIDQYINTKTGDDKITGEVHNAVLHEIVESVLEISGTGFGGNLSPDDDPGDQINPIWYLASEIGTFTYCSGLEVTALPAFIVWKEDAWSITQIGVPTDTVDSTNTGLKGIARAGDPEPSEPSIGDWYVYIGSEELAWAGENTIDSPGIVILDSTEPTNSWVLYAFGYDKTCITEEAGDISFALSDETSDLTTDNDASIEVIRKQKISSITFSVNTAPEGSSILVDVKKNGSSILNSSIELTDGSTSVSITDFSDADLEVGNIVTADITQIGATTAGAGAKIYLKTTLS
jgi:hypothetical protein